MSISRNTVIYFIFLIVALVHGQCCYEIFIKSKSWKMPTHSNKKVLVKTIQLQPKIIAAIPKNESNRKVVIKNEKETAPISKKKIETQKQIKKHIPNTCVSNKAALLKQAKEKVASMKQADDSSVKGAKEGRVSLPVPIDMETSQETSSHAVQNHMAYYNDELKKRIRLELRLPEHGDVRVKLILRRSGSVIEVEIIESNSEKNRYYVENNLPQMRFPPFGKEFKGDSEQTFNLCLSSHS